VHELEQVQGILHLHGIKLLQKKTLRWFHDGCCECVGSSCQARPENQFGIDQSRCEECPLLEDEEDISDEEMEQLVNMDYEEFGESTIAPPVTEQAEG